MLEVKGSFRVNKVRMIQSNIQYAVLFLLDRMVFVKIGGQFADGGFAGTAVGGVLGGALGGLVGATVDMKIQKSATEKRTRRLRRSMNYQLKNCWVVINKILKYFMPKL